MKGIFTAGIGLMLALAFYNCDSDNPVFPEDFHRRPGSFDILRNNWKTASLPADGKHTFRNRLSNFVWFNPFEQVPVLDIYPDRDLNPNIPSRVHVLRFFFLVDQEQVSADRNIWGGVMQRLPLESRDLTQADFIEVMVQGSQGRLHIDLGAFTEDVIPNGILDSEDRVVGGFRNGILDEGEDIGIDGIAKPDPPTANFPRKVVNADSSFEAVPYDFWDVNHDGIKNVDEPWSYDDWFYRESEPFVYFREENKGGWNSISGTENNADDEGGNVPDTEDINQNGILDQVNAYFSFSFSLSIVHMDTALIVGGNLDVPLQRGGPWKLYRIPFVDKDEFKIGNPSKNAIEFVRIWFDELEETDTPIVISIAEIVPVKSESIGGIKISGV